MKQGEADWHSLILKRRMKKSKQNCKMFKDNVGLDSGKRLISGSTLMGLPQALPPGVQVGAVYSFLIIHEKYFKIVVFNI